jgi:DNA-binding transcriptional ArsR family regulator
MAGNSPVARDLTQVVLAPTHSPADGTAILVAPPPLSPITYNQMVVYKLSEAEIDRIFQALADATRRDIVTRVISREQSVSDLAREYTMTFAAVQKHVAVLERAMLITKERRGREQIVHGDPTMLRRATRLLETYEEIWRARVQRIDQMLTEDGERSLS